jgi:hypothetical protein
MLLEDREAPAVLVAGSADVLLADAVPEDVVVRERPRARDLHDAAQRCHIKVGEHAERGCGKTERVEPTQVRKRDSPIPNISKKDSTIWY